MSWRHYARYDKRYIPVARPRGWFQPLLIALSILGPAQAGQPYAPTHPDPLLDHWRWRTFHELEGRGLQAMTEAADGSIWFGVDSGALHYDGIHWTSYSTADGVLGDPVRTILGTSDGSVYTGTELGISRFVDGGWQHVYPMSGDLPCPTYDLLEAADGSIWAGTAWGALRMAPGDTTLFTSADLVPVAQQLFPRLAAISTIPAPKEPWVGGIGLVVVRGDEHPTHGSVPWVVAGIADGSPAFRAGLRLGDRVLAVDGTLVPRSMTGVNGASVELTVVRRATGDTTDIQLAHEDLSGGFAPCPVFDLFEDDENHLWMGLYSGSLVTSIGIPGDNRGWRLFTAQDGLEQGEEPRIAQAHGDVWAVSNDAYHGVNRYHDGAWSVVPPSTEPWTPVHSSILRTGDGDLWLGGFFLVRFDGSNWSVYTSSDVPMPTQRVRLLEASDGALWVGGLGAEVARLERGPGRWLTYRDLHFQAEDHDGRRWFTARDAQTDVKFVVCHDPATDRWAKFDERDGLMAGAVSLLVTRNGDVWAAGGHHGEVATSRFDGENWSTHVHSGLSHSTRP